MTRDIRDYLTDIDDMITTILDFSDDMSYDAFQRTKGRSLR